MKQRKLVIFAVLAGLMSGTAAQAASFGLAANVNYGLSSSSNGLAEAKGALGYGGGLVIAFPSGNNMLDLGVHYVMRKFTASDTLGLGISTSVTASALHIPLVYHLGMGGMALGLGGFYDMSMEDGGGSNFGLTGGLRFGKSSGLFLDARYNMVLATGGTKEVLALIGLMFGGK